MTAVDRTEVLRAASMLAEAFRRRDLQAALNCFVADGNISYVGSEPGERADGTGALTALLTALFNRPEAYSWNVHTATIHAADSFAYVSCEATGHLHPDAGHHQSFPYRLSGLLQQTDSGWKWRACHACEPCPPAGCG
jgi:ketosteroid isomerase-like protein